MKGEAGLDRVLTSTAANSFLANDCCFIDPEAFCMRLSSQKPDMGIVSWNRQ